MPFALWHSSFQASGRSPHDVTEQDIERHLYTSHMPDPDLLVRTSGEMRISNYLLWQIAYAEIFVTDRLWPDFRGLHLLEAIEDYQKRETSVWWIEHRDRVRRYQLPASQPARPAVGFRARLGPANAAQPRGVWIAPAA